MRHSRQWRVRSARLGRGLAACLLLGAVVTACASGSPGGGASRAPATRLAVTYAPHGAGVTGAAHHTWTLTCAPTGGTLPSRQLACRELAAHGEDLINPGVECMVIVRGGPMATVTGTWQGRAVRFSSTTCSRAWTTLRALLTGSG